MKQFLPVVWWLSAALVIALVLTGLGYLFADALLLGVLFLPGMLTARYFVPQLSFERRREGNPQCRLPRAGDPRHRIPLADAGPCGSARNRRRRNAGTAAQPALHPAAPDGLHRPGDGPRKPPRTPLPPTPLRSASSPTAAKSRSTRPKSSTSNRTTARYGFTPPRAEPTVPRPASRNGRHSWTAVSCASTARSSSTRHASTAAAPGTWKSAA